MTITEQDKQHDNTLLRIIASEKLKDLYNLIGKDHSKNLAKDIDQSLNIRLKANHRALLLMRTMTSTATIPFILLWTIISLTSLSMPMLIVATSLAALTTLILTPLIYIGRQNEEQKLRRQTLKELAHTVLKQEASKALLQQHYPDDIAIIAAMPALAPSASIINKKYYLTHLQKGLETAFETGCTFLSTYFAGAYAILSAFSATAIPAILTGGISLSIALGIFFIAGCYFGVQQYRASREESYCRAWQKQGLKFIEQNHDAIEQIKEINNETAAPPVQHQSTLRFFAASPIQTVNIEECPKEKPLLMRLSK